MKRIDMNMYFKYYAASVFYPICMISKLLPRPVVGYPFVSKFKGCVRYIFASLFFKSKREPLSN